MKLVWGLAMSHYSLKENFVFYTPSNLIHLPSWASETAFACSFPVHYLNHKLSALSWWCLLPGWSALPCWTWQSMSRCLTADFACCVDTDEFHFLTDCEGRSCLGYTWIMGFGQCHYKPYLGALVLLCKAGQRKFQDTFPSSIMLLKHLGRTSHFLAKKLMHPSSLSTLEMGTL